MAAFKHPESETSTPVLYLSTKLLTSNLAGHPTAFSTRAAQHHILRFQLQPKQSKRPNNAICTRDATENAGKPPQQASCKQASEQAGKRECIEAI
eukprot:380594-Pelagomonas_calceolata.AAC.5